MGKLLPLQTAWRLLHAVQRIAQKKNSIQTRLDPVYLLHLPYLPYSNEHCQLTLSNLGQLYRQLLRQASIYYTTHATYLRVSPTTSISAPFLP
ncbi:hypothetical protein HYQ46_006164 [Verticillium longisporum]|nr:hypothetical protein HYQ46_006164 [Verticillium longisporum]